MYIADFPIETPISSGFPSLPRLMKPEGSRPLRGKLTWKPPQSPGFLPWKMNKCLVVSIPLKNMSSSIGKSLIMFLTIYD